MRGWFSARSLKISFSGWPCSWPINFSLFQIRATYLVVKFPGNAWAAPFGSDEQFQLRYIHSVDFAGI